MEEDKKVIAHYFGYSNYKTFAEDEQIKKSMGTLSKSIVNIINELERLQKEFEVLDRECSRLERKEIELEKENTFIKNENVALQMTHDYDLQMIDEVKGEYVKLYNKFEVLKKENEDWQRAYQEEKDEQFNMLTKKCSHCGENTPLYCETCYQELISKNAELQLENNQLKRKIFDLYNSSGEYEKAKCIMTKELRDYIPKQIIRDKIQLLEKELKLLDKKDSLTLMENDSVIYILKELLKN